MPGIPGRRRQIMLKNLKERIVGITGSISGVASVMGSWQVCHSVCLAIVALLGIIGISVAGMPLAFLTEIAVPLWLIAMLLLIVVIALKLKKNCVSNRMIMFNSGVIIAGIPFQQLQDFSALFWTAGGALVAVSIFLFAREKMDKSSKISKRSDSKRANVRKSNEKSCEVCKK